MLIPLHHIVLPPGPPAGMDLAMIGLWTVPMRRTPQPCTEPIHIRQHPCGQHYEITDGRHRYVAANVAGRTHIDTTLG